MMDVLARRDGFKKKQPTAIINLAREYLGGKDVLTPESQPSMITYREPGLRHI